MSQLDYLTKHYLNASSKPEKKSKKRKRKADSAASASQGLIIEDDDATGWDSGRSGVADGDNDDATGWDSGRNGVADGDNDDESGPVIAAASNRSAEFRKAKTSNWKTLTGAPAKLPGEGDDPSRPSSRQEQQQQQLPQRRRKKSEKHGDADDAAAAADAIIASAAAESKAKGEGGDEDDDDPAIDEDGDAILMESGAHAGLQTAAQNDAQMRRAALKRLREQEKDGGGVGSSSSNSKKKAQEESETVYRDASGRIVDVAWRRAEARKQAAADAARQAEEVEERKGDVQRAEAARRREDLRNAKTLTVARYADDEDLNAELKDRERWNDPANMFMPKKDDARKGAAGMPVYKGHAPPNRYGIRPGHRWDGVDRGTGFEKEYFAAQNRRKNVRDLEYAWQMDD